ncbi:winged helix-turn-helix domain-containing protein [Rosistilla oblonga]|uniref:OmpR/PhoB-type domain-containing protein n=1 Tax=Rosistilla oblonga TaxID=2527990 RepID=A0A518IT64_9BACT|nr:helix-turn-helix domain-containing protein [Rosistilla oblonga]QDV56278.1 hypothetical protein Mal33_22600 [Rosistilla oblonga]
MSVRIVHGANEGRFTLAGQTVRSIAKSLRDAFNIPEDAQTFVGGAEVSGDHVVADGETVEFVRTLGHKGGLNDFWSEREVTEFFGASAIADMADMEIRPVNESVFTSQQINNYLSRLTKPGETQHKPSPLIVDLSSMTLTYYDQAPIEIEGSLIFKLLNRLNVRPRHYVRLDTLKRDVWEDEFIDDQTVNRTARRLRKKLEEMQVQGVQLKTQNGGWALIFSDS